jgi:hypothetical protein
VDFSSAESRVFQEVKGKFYIGGVEVQPQVLEVLKDQARYFVKSQLLELLDATLKNEAANLAVIQSGSSGDIVRDVMSAKMLHHWNFVLQNMIVKLANANLVDKK